MNDTCCSKERGLVIPLFALLVLAAITIIAMVIEHSRASLTLTGMQRAIDAASLSAAKQLDGREGGWQKAKSAALRSIKDNIIHGVANNTVKALQLTSGVSSWLKAGTQNSGTEGQIAGFHLTVERGLMMYDENLRDGEGGYHFLPLEESPNWKGVPTYLIANAVKVTAHLDTLSTTFGKFLGVLGFSNFDKVSIARTDQESEVEVAPFAIPYCNLLLDTSPYTTGGSHLTKFFDSVQQRQRPLMFAEANPKGTLLSWSGMRDASVEKNRREGLTRCESYFRQPYVSFNSGGGLCYPNGISAGMAQNCKHVPMYGVMGVPVAKNPRTAANGDDIRRAVELASRGKLKASVGHYFKSLEKITNRELDGAARQSLVDFITNGNTTFAKEFTDATPQGSPIPWTAKDNFPFIRTFHPCGQADPEKRPVCDPQSQDADLEIAWPTSQTDDSGSIIVDKMNMDQRLTDLAQPHIRRAGDYSNLMGHDDLIPLDNPGAHNVRRMKVPVIAAYNERLGNGQAAQLCDWNAVFSGSAPDAVAPVTSASLIVVGFVDIVFYDLNVQDLGILFAGSLQNPDPNPRYGIIPTVTPAYPRANPTKFDRFGGELVLSQDDIGSIQAKERSHKKAFESELEDCRKKLTGCSASLQPSYEDVVKEIIPIAYRRCFNVSKLYEDLQNAGFPDISDCITGDNDDACADALDGYQKKNIFSLLETFLSSNIPTWDFTHCLPQLAEDKYDKSDPNSIEPLHSLHGGYGCGAVMAKLTNEGNDKLTLVTGEKWENTAPALVAEDQ